MKKMAEAMVPRDRKTVVVGVAAFAVGAIAGGANTETIVKLAVLLSEFLEHLQ